MQQKTFSPPSNKRYVCIVCEAFSTTEKLTKQNSVQYIFRSFVIYSHSLYIEILQLGLNCKQNIYLKMSDSRSMELLALTLLLLFGCRIISYNTSNIIDKSRSVSLWIIAFADFFLLCLVNQLVFSIKIKWLTRQIEWTTDWQDKYRRKCSFPVIFIFCLFLQFTFESWIRTL